MATIEQLQIMANRLRIDSIRATTAAGSGHPTTCLSAADLVSALFFSVMKPQDEFVLSKGHAAPLLWAAYAEAGIIDPKELIRLRKIDSMLEGHPTPRMPLVKVASGSLGQGLSAGVGMALAKRLRKNDGRVFVLLGDGECAEGAVWEAANAAADYRLNRLVALVDINGLGQSQETMHRRDAEAYAKKFIAFGWRTIVIDGHSIPQILEALGLSGSGDLPLAILAKTHKGQGVSFLQDKNGWHGKPLNKEEMEKALSEIYVEDIQLPSAVSRKSEPVGNISVPDFPLTPYKPEEMVATRAAFGKALVSWGRADPTVVAVDADVKNSTMLEGFFREFPDRSFQTYIAEQNMVGMAIGFSASGYSPVVSTFAAFLTRAYDFIRMAVYSRANIKFAGSHAGVSIGPDGPSQMGLEDLAMFLVYPETLVLYPSDAVSCEHLLREMAKHRGISYLRMTREKTPILYSPDEPFPLGSLKVVRRSPKDQAVIVAAGITLHEALRAQEILNRKGIPVRVIDLYCVKPFPAAELLAHIEECGGRVITVEDHYDGGIGSVVAGIFPHVDKLFVQEIPRSGPMEQLLEMVGISASAIVSRVEKTLNA